MRFKRIQLSFKSLSYLKYLSHESLVYSVQLQILMAAREPW